MCPARRRSVLLRAAALTLSMSVGADQVLGQYLPERRLAAGIVGSVATPTGDFAQKARSGFAVTALLQLTRSFWGVRGELGYASFGGDRVTRASGQADAPPTRILSGTIDAVLGAGTLGKVVRPYFVAGGGVYRFDSGGARTTGFPGHDLRRTALGLNAGIAVRFPVGPLTGVVESRLHHVFGDPPTRFLTPIGFGITF